MANDFRDNSRKVLILVRHGEAKSSDEDPQRPLTEHGERMVQSMAAWLASTGVKVAEIHHSGKMRAEQTARIFADHLRPPTEPASRSGLNPNDDVGPIAESLMQQQHSLMLVGHLPFLGRLISELILQDSDRPLVQLETAAVMMLHDHAGQWTITGLVQPHLLGSIGS